MRRLLPRIDRLSWKLGASIAVLVVGGQLAGFFLAYRQWSAHLLAALERQTEQQTTLIRLALEHQMLQRDLGLVGSMVASFGSDPSLQRLMILDREGTVRLSSDPALLQKRFPFTDPTCQACHRLPPDARSRDVLMTVNGGRVLRAVQPLRNDARCQSCHEPARRINGIIVADVPLEPALASLEKEAGKLALGTSAIGLVLLAGIGGVVRRLVLRRLRRFEAGAKALGAGDLSHRVPVEHDDALGRVETQFNGMADSLAGVLGELRAQRASLERVLNSVDDGMVVLDRARIVEAANDAYWRRFGDGTPRPGRPCCREGADAPGCSGGPDCPTLECFRTGRVQTSMRTRTLADGSLRHEEVRASPVPGPGGTVAHVVEVWRDVTDRRSAEARLAEQQRMVSLGMLASGFSHEVNTPLSSIGMCVDGIARMASGPLEPADREKVLEFARIASTQVRRCGDLTEQFLQLARGRPLAGDTVDLGSCAELGLRLCKHRANEAGVALEFVPPAGTATVRANAAAVQQVLLNLVMNSIEACARGGRVRVHVTADGAPALVVADDGRGIAAEDLPHVFEPFFTRRANGTGLGLFISLNLARSWGGDIRVTSAPGRGTTSTVTFAQEPRPPGAA